MVQDTSLQNEMYLARLGNNKCGGWGIQPAHGDYDPNAIDPDYLGTASIFWTVSVPAESSWRTAEFAQPDSSALALPLRSYPLTSFVSKLSPTSVLSASQVPHTRSPSHRRSSQGTLFKSPLGTPLTKHPRYMTMLTWKTCIRPMWLLSLGSLRQSRM